MKVLVSALCLVCILVLIPKVCAQPLKAQSKRLTQQTGSQDESVVQFLNTDKELREIYDVRFTGRFEEIPKSLDRRLLGSFPEFSFRIAEMEVFADIPPLKMPLILVAERKSGKVAGFIWGVTWGMPSRSVRKMFHGVQRAKDECSFQILTVLADLIAQTGNVTVGESKTTDHYVEISILNGKSVFRTLRLESNSDGYFGDFSMLRQDGKPIVQQ